MRRWPLLVAILALASVARARATEHNKELAIIRDGLHWDSAWDMRNCRTFREGQSVAVTDIKWGAQGFLILPDLGCKIHTRVIGGVRRTIMVSTVRPDWTTTGELASIAGSELAEPAGSATVLEYRLRLPNLRDYDCHPPDETDRRSLAANAVRDARGYLGPRSNYHMARVWVPRFCDMDPVVFVLARFIPSTEWVITLFARDSSGGWRGSTLNNSRALASRIEKMTDKVITVSERSPATKP